MTRFRMWLLVVGALGPLAATAQEPPDQVRDEGAIRKAVAAYVEAFNQHDAGALANYWSPDAVYINRTTREQVVGQKAIEQQFVALFEQQQGLKIDVSTESIQFISPNVAVEHGVAHLLVPESEPETVNYTTVYVKRDGKWLLDRVTDDTTQVTPSAYEQLKDLQWMIGNWVDEDENARIETQCSWTRNNSFMTRSFTVSIEDRIDIAGMQIIGWDPATKVVRSWTFDSDGGFAGGTWTRKGNRWFVHKTGILADGRKGSAVNIINRVDDDTFTLQSVSRSVDGEILPNIDEVRVVRVDGQ